MKYHVHGADATTGADRSLQVDADSKEDAVAKLNKMGVLPYRILPAPYTAQEKSAKVAIVGGLGAILITLIWICVGIFTSVDPAVFIGVGVGCASAAAVCFAVWYWIKSDIEMQKARAEEEKKLAAMSPAQREQHFAIKRKQQEELKKIEEEQKRLRQEEATTYLYGQINAKMICPHCQEKGQIRTKKVERKKGVSGGKATAAVLTGGVSLLATGLSREELLTQAHCFNCGNTWEF